MSILDDVDFHPEITGNKTRSMSQSKKGKSLPSKRKTDRWAGGTLKRRQKKDNMLLDGDQDDWKSDDSDWICTDDEDFSSDNDSRRKVKQSCKLILLLR